MDNDPKLFKKVEVVLTRLENFSHQSGKISIQENNDTEKLHERSICQENGENENHDDVRLWINQKFNSNP